MPNISFSKTFNVDIPSVNLIQGNNIKFRFRNHGSISDAKQENNFPYSSTNKNG